MSQSGNAALAPQGHEFALPSPSSSTSELPDEIPDPPNTPRALIEVIRRVISTNKAKKTSKLTQANYTEIFASLDALDTLISDGEHLESALEKLKRELIAELKSPTPTTPTARTYASAASSPLPVLPPIASSPFSPIPSTAKTSELTILVDKDSDVLSLPPTEIKARVEAAIAATKVEKLAGIALRGVKILSRGRLLVAVDSKKTATLLKHVPTTLNPSSPGAAAQLYAMNRSVFMDPSAITSMQWLNPKAVWDPKKKASSLLVTISDVPSADQCIARGLAVESTICYPHRYEEPPLVCFNCQQYGHTQHHCRQSTPTCARCAGPHRSPSCPCTTSSTKCGPGKRCEHYSPRCANCQGKHPSYHRDCPVRISQCELQRERHRGRIFFDPNFDPLSDPHDDDAPFFFEPHPTSATPSAPSL
ncbi:hypothetical protein C8F04DRAFT_1365997 [Mycena alexandri]|uniref:CCHC-type domain-containing protein n=1 Tax=Mycena alexandri TaxID=1745969 RepID=A0AAD6RV59_9AGAR|nr:hypothetical protein C8F04DRAFT_1365997 [Mycena alexandri]